MSAIAEFITKEARLNGVPHADCHYLGVVVEHNAWFCNKCGFGGVLVPPEVAANFDEFWHDIVMPGRFGQWDHAAILRELHDYSVVLEQVPLVYQEITMNRMSKPNYLASEVIGVHAEVCPFRGDLDEMAKRLRAAIAMAPSLPMLRDRLEEIIGDYASEDE